MEEMTYDQLPRDIKDAIPRWEFGAANKIDDKTITIIKRYSEEWSCWKLKNEGWEFVYQRKRFGEPKRRSITRVSCSNPNCERYDGLGGTRTKDNTCPKCRIMQGIGSDPGNPEGDE